MLQSSSGIHGYGTFRDGVMKGVDSALTSDPKTSTAQRKANRWADIPEKQSRPSVPPKPQRGNNADDMYNPSASDRSTSPKPLTSNPPLSGDVKKPQPKTPPNGSPETMFSLSVVPPNYENQSELDRMQGHYYPKAYNQTSNAPRSTMQMTQSTPASVEHSPPPGSSADQSQEVPVTDRTPQSQKDKKSQSQFSLKAWLKREREQVRKEVDSSMEQPDAKPQSPSRSFSKFKHSVKQKFSTGASKKVDSNSKKSKDQRQHDYQQQGSIENPNYSPYDILKGNQAITSRSMYPSEDDSRSQPIHLLPSLESDFNGNPNSDTVISPLDDPEADDILVPMQGNANDQIDSINPSRSGKYMPRTNGISDMNNNNKYSSSFKPGMVGHDNVENAQDNPRQNYDTRGHENAFVSPGAESKRIVAVAAPVYQARVINNYENQGKFDTPNVPRQQARPAKPLRMQNNDLNGGLLNGDIPRGSHNVDSPLRYDGAGGVYKTQMHNDRPLDNQGNCVESSPYYHISRMFKTPEKTPTDNHSQASNRTSHSKDMLQNQNYITPRKRVPMNVQSIGSLIDKFDNTETHKHETDGRQDVNTHLQNGGNGNSSSPNGSGLSPPLPPRSRHLSPQSSTGHSNTPSGPPLFTSPERPSFQPSHSTSALSQGQCYKSAPVDSSKYPSNNTQYQGRALSQCGTPNRTHNNFAGTQTSYDNNRDNNQQSNGYHSNYPPTNGYRDNRDYNNGNHSNIGRTDDRDDGYRAKLRQAANCNQSAFGRLSKTSPQYMGRPSFGSPQNGQTNFSNQDGGFGQSPLHNNAEVSYMAL